MVQLATEVKSFTCICCPLGCQLEAFFSPEGNLIETSGYLCAQGKSYAEEESVAPKRMVCAAVCIEGSLEPLSVKTANPVLKELIPNVLEAIAQLKLQAPVVAGSVVVKNIADTGVDLLATKSLPPVIPASEPESTASRHY
jgi:CxxC motif-containing protein